ncbi:hypothetical protein PpBr36_03747 [Pyricularia pennisetigena]|uniref:hypothetical protein n=1 Tax=Pyricularia pennisetigena TaxID=1578925 RepID=UPI00114FBB8F|nr:hypothetical protein PpBr36_03747 [Pyricularia pennisetigena]TLS31082.1 hypothetical protein PpBr36_03747 [Pyricularia pennisetigena]
MARTSGLRLRGDRIMMTAYAYGDNAPLSSLRVDAGRSVMCLGDCADGLREGVEQVLVFGSRNEEERNAA